LHFGLFTVIIISNILGKEHGMKKVFLIDLILFLVLTGCTSKTPEEPQPHPSTPERTVSNYLDAALSGNDIEAYMYLTSQDREAVSKEIFRTDLSEDSFLSLVAKQVSYTIKKTLSDGESAFVDVELTAPDTSILLDNLHALIKRSPLKTEEDRKQLKTDIVHIFYDGEAPLVTREMTFNLRKESGQWKIFFDIETRTRIADLYAEAAVLEGEKKIKEAEEKYKEILTLNKNDARAVQKLEALAEKPKVKQQAKSEDYLYMIKIFNIRVAESERGNLGVFGEIQNLGKKTLSKVTIKITYLDAHNKTIYTEKYSPVDIAGSELRSRMPLKPGKKKRFGYTVKKEPPKWSKKVTVAVTGYSFAQKRKR